MNAEEKIWEEILDISEYLSRMEELSKKLDPNSFNPHLSNPAGIGFCETMLRFGNKLLDQLYIRLGEELMSKKKTTAALQDDNFWCFKGIDEFGLFSLAHESLKKGNVEEAAMYRSLIELKKRMKLESFTKGEAKDFIEKQMSKEKKLLKKGIE